MGWKPTKVYSNHFFHTVELTSSNYDFYNWDIECVIEIANTPLLNPNAPLAQSAIRKIKTNISNSSPGAKVKCSSSATENMDMPLYKRYKCKKCKQQTTRTNKKNPESSLNTVI